ncbi:hypothetical protein [Kitasatospora sp. NPDC097643]|uniref:hypothetical protein n=1 Tax=Kitasatospora sp. NPDC097643 TaxID=3157230 RepID=UPI00333321A1
MLLLGLLLMSAAGAFAGLLIADNLSGGPDYQVTVLGNDLARLDGLEIFLFGLALALVFCIGLALTGRTPRGRRPRRWTGRRPARWQAHSAQPAAHPAAPAGPREPAEPVEPVEATEPAEPTPPRESVASRERTAPRELAASRAATPSTRTTPSTPTAPSTPSTPSTPSRRSGLRHLFDH